MPTSRTIALDAMGGDHGPEVVISGAALSRARHPDLEFLFFGDESKIRAQLEKHEVLSERVEVIHTDKVVDSHEKPGLAVRRGKGTSMWLAIEAVRDKRAKVAVSAGNTGALMGMSKLILRPMSSIERPAIAALWPTIESECIVLDVGANIGASARQLSDYALMGAAMARELFHVEKPTVGLLNVGVEDIKGDDVVKLAHSWLKDTDLPLDYRGFVEGDQIGQGVVDVVVVEGFAGNIALKTAEGTARQISQYLKDAMMRTWMSKIGALLAKGGFRVLKHKMDPRRVNGGTFLGLNGIVIKSHGGTDPLGFASAVDLGHEMAASGLLRRLTADLEAFHHILSEAEAG
ncbi:MAG: phosphate acyltransferase PlsX [Hyphomicrobiaceae bacterium]